MSAKKIRSVYMGQFSQFDKYTDIQAWAVFGSYVLQALITISIGHILLTLPTTALTISLMVFCMIFVGTRLRALNNIVHECSHMTFASVRQTNKRVGSIAASLVLSCFEDYRQEHMTHHMHLGDYEKDKDLQSIQDLRLHDPLSLKTVLRHIVTPFLGRHLPYYLGVNFSRRDGLACLSIKIGLILMVLGMLYFATWTALMFVLLPYVVLYSALNYWTDCFDHAGLVASNDDLDASRNVLAKGVVRMLFFPRSDCFHLVHHLFPQVPARHLETCHDVLLNEDDYRGRKHAAWRNADESVFKRFLGLTDG